MSASVRRSTVHSLRLAVGAAALVLALGASVGSATASAALPTWTVPTPSGEVTSLTFRFNVKASEYPNYPSGFPASVSGNNAEAAAAGNQCQSTVCFQLGTSASDAGWKITSVSKVNVTGSTFDLDVVVSAGAGASDAWVMVFSNSSTFYKVVGGPFPSPSYYASPIFSDYVWGDTPTPDAPWVGTCGPSSCSNLPATSSDANPKIFFTTYATGTSFLCSLDGASFAECAGGISKIPDSPYSIGPLSAGPHSFAVKATKGVYTSATTTVTWTVSGVSPSAPEKPALTGTPAAQTKQTSASVSFTSSGATSYTCSVDSATPSACTSPLELSGLSEGAHTLSVVAKGAGDTSSDAATASWTVDTTPPNAPSLTRTSPTASSTTDRTASISASAETGATITCSVDGGGYAACTSPIALSSLAVGAHSVSVKATDAAGNVSNATTTSWTVTSTPVVTPVTNPVKLQTFKIKSGVNKGAWSVNVGQVFTTGGDRTPSRQLATVQVSTTTTATPSNGQAIPTKPSYAQGIVGWSSTLIRSGGRPTWIRVGNKAGKWTNWVKVTLK